MTPGYPERTLGNHPLHLIPLFSFEATSIEENWHQKIEMARHFQQSFKLVDEGYRWVNNCQK